MCGITRGELKAFKERIGWDTPLEDIAGEEVYVDEYSAEEKAALFVFTEAKEFVAERGLAFALDDGWICYYDYQTSKYRKCKPDLTQDEIAYYYNPSCINQDGYSIQSKLVQKGRYYEGHPEYKPSEWEYFIYNSNDGSVEETGLSSVDNEFRNIVLYGDSIYLYDPEKDRLDIYSRGGDFVKTIASGLFYKFAVIDDAVYFYSGAGDMNEAGPASSVMRYSINSGFTETVFGVDTADGPSASEWCEPGIWYEKRTIIVKNKNNSYVYTDIDAIEPKEILFESVKNERDMVNYIPGDDDCLYFEVRYHLGGADEEPVTRSEFYKVQRGAAKPILLMEFDFEGYPYPMCFYDGYFYYYNDGSSGLERVKTV